MRAHLGSYRVPVSRPDIVVDGKPDMERDIVLPHLHHGILSILHPMSVRGGSLYSSHLQAIKVAAGELQRMSCCCQAGTCSDMQTVI